MSYSLDIKLTIWERLEFDSKEEMEDVRAKLENGELKSGSDVSEYLDRSTIYLDETSLEIKLEDNDFQPTMEILDEEGDSI